VFEGIFDVGPRLVGVALELIASLGAQARVPGAMNPTITATRRTTNPTMTIMSTPLILVLELQYTPHSQDCQHC
jgi:hypothetical protein